MRSGIHSWVSLLPLLPACWWGVDGNGNRLEEARPLEGFTEVVSHGELDVLIERGDTFSVVVSLDSNLLDEVETEVRGGVLRIGLDEQVFDKVSGPHVRVVMPHLTSLTLDGSGDVDAFRFDELEPVRVRLAGSGDLRFEGSAPALRASLDGSGDLELAGSAEQLELSLDGSGDLDARHCPAASASLRLDGSGDLSATVNGDVRAAVRGSGDIDLFGAAVLTESSVRGSGDVHVH